MKNNDTRLDQFVYWLNKAKQFNLENREQMTDSSENTRNFYRNQGAEAERERIIKLLENNSVLDSTDAIALIKGEK